MISNVDRLLDLMHDHNNPALQWLPNNHEILKLVEYLDGNGAIALPCKVGDTVYIITECSCEDIDGVYTECEFYGYGTDDRICTIPNGANCPYQYRIVGCVATDMNILTFARRCGKTVFLTREEAEQALREAQGNE